MLDFLESNIGIGGPYYQSLRPGSGTANHQNDYDNTDRSGNNGNVPTWRSVQQSIFDDNETELDEGFVVTLWQGNLLVDTATVIILDDDTVPGGFDEDYNPDYDTGTTPSFNPAPGANAEVLAVDVQADGKAVIGGRFTSVNSFVRYLPDDDQRCG